MKKVNVILGGVYYDAKHHEVNVQFIDTRSSSVSYDRYCNGRKTCVVDVPIADLQKLLLTGGFKLDHVERW